MYPERILDTGRIWFKIIQKGEQSFLYHKPSSLEVPDRSLDSWSLYVPPASFEEHLLGTVDAFFGTSFYQSLQDQRRESYEWGGYVYKLKLSKDSSLIKLQRKTAEMIGEVPVMNYRESKFSFSQQKSLEDWKDVHDGQKFLIPLDEQTVGLLNQKFSMRFS